MDAAQFLARVVAPGNFLAVCFKGVDKLSLSARFFPRDNTGDAAGYIRWCAEHNMDVWYCPASYRMASPRSDGKFDGERKQLNVQSIRCFWFDADVKRDGDKKQAGSVFTNQTHVFEWLKELRAKTGINPPNLVVNSGYGYHLYWVIEEALAPDVWLPRAHAFRELLRTGGAIGDLKLTIDSARLLRPPGTFNLKVPAAPAPVEVLSQCSKGEIPLEQLDEWLTPYRAVGRQSVDQGARSTNRAASGGTTNYSSNVLAGAPPTILAAHRSTTTTAAQTGVGYWFDRLTDDQKNELLQEIARRPGIVALADAGDRLWLDYLFAFADASHRGATEAHTVALKWAKTSSKFVSDQDFNKDWNSFKPNRPGGISVATLLDAAAKDGFDAQRWKDPVNGDLPDGYERRNGSIFHKRVDREGEVSWTQVLPGDVSGPVLDRIDGAYQLIFTYEGPDRKSTVVANMATLPSEPGRIVNYFGPMGLVLDTKQNADLFRGFIVAWISKLRALNAVRGVAVQPFGWAMKPDGSYGGVAVGGTLYRSDGSEENAPGADQRLVDKYQPHGSLAKWKQAAALVLTGRPDLQVIVGVSFGAPLMEHTGHAGVIFSTWSWSSAVGKSSAFRVGATVWGEESTMLSFDDTANSVHYRIGQTRILPAYWDEIHVDETTSKSIVNTLFKLAQGRDKARMRSDITLRETGEWKTLLMASGNRSLMSPVVDERSETDAGALRLFEWEIDAPQLRLDSTAAQTIAQASQNPGHAGRIYAKWLAEHTDAMRASLNKMSKMLEKDLQADQGERFYVAGMSCVLVGAGIAKMLGLVDFDVTAMHAFLKNVFFKLRSERLRNIPISSGGKVDLDRIIGRFIADHTMDRLVTTIFARPGRSRLEKQDILLNPINSVTKRIVIHIAQKQQLMRIDKDIWGEWCRSHNISASALYFQMMMRYGATEQRGLMAAGTPYATGKVVFIVLPISAPELSVYNYDFSDSSNPKVQAAALITQ